MGVKTERRFLAASTTDNAFLASTVMCTYIHEMSMATKETHMAKLNLWKFGVVLSLAVGLNYILCATIWSVWTEPSMDFLNALFHGLDIRKFQTVPLFQCHRCSTL